MSPVPPLSPAFAVGPERPLPARTQIVVIGGGIAGVAAALYLARWGIPVVLCEKGRIAGEQSSRNWGWVRKMGRDVRELPLMIESQNLWHQLSHEVDSDIGFREGGSIYLALDEQELAEREAWLNQASGFQLDTRLLTAKQAADALGQDEGRFVGALATPSDCHAEPSLAVRAMARLAASEGAEIFEGTAVRVIERQGGKVFGVVTEHGRVGCEQVILAGGIWSRPFLENLGIDLPQLAVQSSVQRTSEAPEITGGTVGATGASIRRRADGGYTIARTGAARFDLIPAAFKHLRAFAPLGWQRRDILKVRAGAAFFGPLGRHRWGGADKSPFEQVRVMDPVPDDQLLDEVLVRAKELYPQLREVRSVERWGGMIDVTPDELPVIGPVGGAEGLTVATGLSGHGFGLGPGFGYLAAQLATDRQPIVDPTPFALTRFA